MSSTSDAETIVADSPTEVHLNEAVILGVLHPSALAAPHPANLAYDKESAFTQSALLPDKDGLVTFELSVSPTCVRLVLDSREQSTERVSAREQSPSLSPRAQAPALSYTDHAPMERTDRFAVSPCGRVLVTCHFAAVRIWSLDTHNTRVPFGHKLGEFTSEVAHDRTVWDAAFHPSLPFFATASSDNLILLWKFTPGEGARVYRRLTHHNDDAYCVDFTEHLFISSAFDRSLQLFTVVRSGGGGGDGDDGQDDVELELHKRFDLVGHTDAIVHARIDHVTESIAASCGNDRVIRVWSTEDGTCLRKLHKFGRTEFVLLNGFLGAPLNDDSVAGSLGFGWMHALEAGPLISLNAPSVHGRCKGLASAMYERNSMSVATSAGEVVLMRLPSVVNANVSFVGFLSGFFDPLSPVAIHFGGNEIFDRNVLRIISTFVSGLGSRSFSCD